jgi:rSAM/selenodomain-associated transferase 1
VSGGPPVDLVVFAKAPVPGRVKTRLAASLAPGGPEAAAALHAAFVEDLCGRVAGLAGFRVRISADPGPEAPFFRGLAERLGLPVGPQAGDDLGARMGHDLRRSLEAGAGCLLIGTDVPTLPIHHLEAAAAALETAALVLGPSSDGGYYLVGASLAALGRWDDVAARLFTDIPWGAGDVLHRTLARAEELAEDLAVALAPAWYDVDEAADLGPLLRHLAAGDPSLPRTTEVLAALGVPAPAGAA